MAGGKETPRQKMIGMMYLVLTALLALQVSNAVLQKFAIINETLLTTISANSSKNAEHLDGIVKDGSKSSDPKVKRAVENPSTRHVPRVDWNLVERRTMAE